MSTHNKMINILTVASESKETKIYENLKITVIS